jgi:hypothetical protein
VIKNVYYPQHILKLGITKNHKGIEPEWNVGAADTETVNGVPNTLQLCWNGGKPIVLRVTPDDILDVFVFYVEQWAKRGTVNVVYFHNLKFDLQALLYRPDHRVFFGGAKRDFIVPIRRKDGQPAMHHEKADDALSPDELYSAYLHAFCDKTWFARLKLSERRRVHLTDTNAFFKMTLKAAAELVGSPVEKLERPEGLGQVDLSGQPAFEEYIRADVLAQYHVGNAVYRLHEEHDIRHSVSLPQLAARILRHKFFREGDSIAFPPVEIARSCELSYHGGKNQMIRKEDGSWAAGFYDKVWEVDINSAYTAAMRDLPSMLKGSWRSVDAFVPGSDGVFFVDGEVNCPYGVIFTHDFQRVEGMFQGLWITSYEIDSALATGCLKIHRAHGYVWEATSTYSPFREFAEHFWDEKARWTAIEGKGGLHTKMAKLYPNSTYGKCVSAILDPDLGELEVGADLNSACENVFRASGLYNPAIATLITGRVRGTYLHTHEHKWKSIHSSTDSIKTQMDPTGDPALGKGLGQWSVEVYGRCMLLRPKLYIHEAEGEQMKNSKTGAPVLSPTTGKPLPKMKYALHGFQGKLFDMLAAADYDHDGKDSPILHGKPYEYFVTHCWSMRQSLIRKKKTVVPLNFEKIHVSLKPILGLGPKIVRELV